MEEQEGGRTGQIEYVHVIISLDAIHSEWTPLTAALYKYKYILIFICFM
jgi:hypothetical protein